MRSFQCIVAIVACLWISQARAQISESDIARKQLELGLFALKNSMTEQSANVTVSPYSIHSAMMLLRLGARGPTAAQMDERLLVGSFSPEAQDSYRKLNAQISRSEEGLISTPANTVWLRSDLKFQKDYLGAAQRTFATEPRSVDFTVPERARAIINEWVSSKTGTLIPHLLPPRFITERTTCVLVNALYFKSAWLHPFSKTDTRERDFWTSSSSSVKVSMMSHSRSMAYFEADGWQGVQLPYHSADFAFVVLVPTEKRAVREVARTLSHDLIIRSLQESASTRVNLLLPRFKVRFSTDLVDQLSAFGLTNLRDGDYSGLSTEGVGGINGVIHESVVSVDEVGTEAAAATAVGMAASGMPRIDPVKPKEVYVDRPFAFALVHRTSSAPLFVGMVGDPR